MGNRTTLLKEISEISFAVDDLTLYLDTHPTDEAALTYYNELITKRKEAMQNYASEFEPLTLDCVNIDENNHSQTLTKYPDTRHWTWSDGPLPWEGDTM